MSAFSGQKPSGYCEVTADSPAAIALPVYWGVAALLPVQGDLVGFQSVLNNPPGPHNTYVFGAAGGNYLWILIPAAYSVPQVFIVAGFPVSFVPFNTTYVVGGIPQSYVAYRSPVTQAGTGIQVVV